MAFTASPHAHRRPLPDERGSLLIEVVITAALLLVVALGVLQALDSADARGGEQRSKAVAGNLAQLEQERLRSLPLNELSNSFSERSRIVRGARYDIVSRTSWITDAAGVSSCTTGAAANYLRITSTVSSPTLRGRTPVTLSSIMTPPARSFNASQGSLAVKIVDRNDVGVPGVPLTLSGPPNASGVTNEQGCVLWGYIPDTTSYTLSFSRPDWVDPAGVSVVESTESVVGEQTRMVVKQYDEAGKLQADFVTRRPSTTTAIATEPRFAMIQNSGPPSVSRIADVAGSRLTSPPLFAFTSAYAVHADNCSAASPPSPLLVAVVSGQVTPDPAATIALPSLDVEVLDDGVAVAGATVRVVTACGTAYTRTTRADGRLEDPGFPWGSGFSLCVTDGVRRHTETVSNTTLPGQDVPVDLATESEAGATCP